MESSSLRSYVVTFGPGPLGLVLLNVHRHAVVSRWQCQPDGTAGQASRLGVTIGSLVVGIAVDGEDIKETKPAEYDTIRKALMFGPRPMRVVFQRLRCVLTPMPVPLPLVVWTGALTLSRLSSPTLVSVLGTGGAQLTLAKSVHSRGYHAIVTWHDSGLSLDVLDYSSTRADGGSRKLHSVVSALDVEGRLAASTGETVADDRIEGLPDLTFADGVQKLQLAFEEAHSCSEFRRVMLALRFPADIEAQAHGLSKPELLLSGELCVWRSYLKSPAIGRWKRYYYRLNSDGALQWWKLRDSGSQPPSPSMTPVSRSTSNDPLPNSKPKKGLCVRAYEVTQDHSQILDASGLRVTDPTSCNLFLMKSKTDSFVLKADSHESAAMWVNFLTQEVLPDSAETQLPSLETSLRYPSRVAPRPVGVTTASLTQPANSQDDGRSHSPDTAPLPYQGLLAGVSEHVREGLRRLRDKPYELYGDPEHAWCLLCAGGSDIDSFALQLQRGGAASSAIDSYEETPFQAGGLPATIAEEPLDAESLPEIDTFELDIKEQASFQKLAESDKGKASPMSKVRNALHLGSKKLIVPNTPSQFNLGAKIVELNRKTKRQQFHAAAFDPVSDGRVRRHHFELLAGKYLLPLCDPFTAGTIFDALVEDASPVDIQNHVSQGSYPQSLRERVLTFDLFEKYVKAVASTVGAHHSQWEDLRDVLQLSPEEVVVRIESMVECSVSLSRPIAQVPVRESKRFGRSRAGTSATEVAFDDRVRPEAATPFTSGKLYISDRNMFFVTKAEVLVVPLLSIRHVGMEFCEDDTHGRRLGLKDADHSLRLPCAEVRCISQEDDDDDGVIHSKMQLAFAGMCGRQHKECGAGDDDGLDSLVDKCLLMDHRSCEDVGSPWVTLTFSRVKDIVLGRGDERVAGGRRVLVANAIRELCEANQLVVASSAKAATLSSSDERNVAGLDGVSAAVSSLAKGTALQPVQKDWKHKLVRPRRQAESERRHIAVWAGVNVLRTRALFKVANRTTNQLLHFSRASYSPASLSVLKSVTNDPASHTWMARLADFASRRCEIEKRRQSELTKFSAKGFSSELRTFRTQFWPPIDAAFGAYDYLLSWDSPFLTLGTMLCLLWLAVANLVKYIIPVFVFANMFGILLYGAMSEEQKRMISERLRPSSTPSGSIMDRYRQLKSTLGTAQSYVQSWNEVIMKIKSLYTWRDPRSTKLFIVIGSFVAFLVSVLPWRVTFALIVLHQFSKRFRDPDPSLVQLSLGKFYDDLPTYKVEDAVYSTCPVAPEGSNLWVLHPRPRSHSNSAPTM